MKQNAPNVPPKILSQKPKPDLNAFDCAKLRPKPRVTLWSKSSWLKRRTLKRISERSRSFWALVPKALSLALPSMRLGLRRSKLNTQMPKLN